MASTIRSRHNPPMPTRRQFLATGLAATTLPAFSFAADEDKTKPRPNRIAISTYSFWRFIDGLKLPIRDCTRQSAASGFDAVEVLHRQLESEDSASLQSRKE